MPDRPAQGAEFDFAIIGAGIFGCYAALFLKRRGYKVILIERETEIWQKASIVNQARLHFGYHYPRSIATAVLANGHRERFYADHEDCVNSAFTKYYGIDAFNSLTDAQQFSRFCSRIGIPSRIVERPDLLASERIEALFETTEYSFDPFLLRSKYISQLTDEAICLLSGTRVIGADETSGEWRIALELPGRDRLDIQSHTVINATYSNLNAVNRMFGVRELDLTHELSEIALLNIPALDKVGLTIMDGPYFSVMPYGLSGLHSLSSVLYTHHSVSARSDPAFNCQSHTQNCRPETIGVCTTCPARPASNHAKMIRQMMLYVREDIQSYYMGSLFTVKTKLQSSYIDDARPTEIGLLHASPPFFSLFSGKINSIYEVESVLDHV